MRGSSLLRRLTLAAFTCAGLTLAPGFVSQASAADFNPSAGMYTVDTTNLTITGPGTNVSGTNQGGVAVFSFGSANIPAGAVLVAHGSRPFELQASAGLTLAGTIDADGTSATILTAGPNAGGSGGGAGGADDSQEGSGPGGGQHGSTAQDGGGGGAFGGAGAAGGSVGGQGGAGGAAYGDLNASLQGGSGGAGASSSPNGQGGGGGGGGVELNAASLTIAASGRVLADGGTGNEGSFGASGGGSGGGVVLHAGTINVTGTVSAKGGAGGGGGGFGDGGGGGGGRIAYQYATLVNAGIAQVTGGASGTVPEGAHGELSPQASGANGVVTQVKAPTVTTGAAGSVSTSGATLTATVNANGNATTYQFQYGTTTAYGQSIPIPAASVGSDTVDHAVSAVLSGLAAGTTYHYRIVATDQLGFTVVGSDMTFTTAKPAVVVKPTVIKGTSVINVGTTSAMLKASLVPGGTTVKYQFEYGTSKRYGKSTTVKTLKGSSKTLSISSLVTGLRPGTTYHYRLVAKNSSTTVSSRDRTFTTRARIKVLGLPQTISKTKSTVVIRIHATSHLKVKHVTVLLGHRRIASGHKSALTLRLALRKLRPGVHTLTVVTTGAGGTTRQTLRFSVASGSPVFTG